MANEYGNYANALTLAAREQTNFNPDSQSWTYTNGGLTFEHTASGGDAMFPFSQPMQPGSKYHFEFTTNSFHSSVYARFAFFLMPVVEYEHTSNPIVNTASKTFQVSLIRSGGTGANEAKFNNSAITTPTNKPTTGSRVTIEVDMSTVGSTTVRYYFNGSLDTTWSSLAFTDTPYYVGIFTGTETDRNGVHSVNFGQTAFSDTVTADHIRLNTASMSTPAVINYEDEYFIKAGISHTNGSTTAVTLPKTVSGGAMVRIKETDGATDWYVFDTVRGANKSLKWNTNSVEDTSTFSDQNLTGTTLTLPGALASGTYLIEVFYVGVYFQILTWTGTTAAISKTYATELDNELGMMCTMHRDDAYSDVLYHKSLSSVEHTLFTDGTGVELDRNNFSAQSAAGFTAQADAQAADININTKTYVTYAWANSGPYSFGSYEGNNDADGPIVNLGGHAQLVFRKLIDDSGGWTTQSSLFETNGNPVVAFMMLSDTRAVVDGADGIDFISTGFKVRSADTGANPTSTVVYGAFGIQPLTDGGINQVRAK